MTFGSVRTIVLAAGFFALAASGAVAAKRQNTDATPLSLDSLPPPAPGFEKPDGIKPRHEKDSGLELPAEIDLGAAQLRFDTNRKETDPIPRVGVDAVDPKLLNHNVPRENPSELEPDYFGFTLSTPTH